MADILYCNVIYNADKIEYHDIFSNTVIIKCFASSIQCDEFEFENKVMMNENYIQPFLSISNLFIDMINNNVLFVEISLVKQSSQIVSIKPTLKNIDVIVSFVQNLINRNLSDVRLRFIFKDKDFIVLV